MSALPPIRRQLVVPADPGRAFEVFTAGIGRWWPLADLSVHGDGSSVAFVDGRIVETAADGQEAMWGEVTRFEPGREVAFTWHPGKGPEHASRVTVTFEPVDGGTEVMLEHTGWEVFVDPVAARAEYEQGWPEVLAAYAAEAAVWTWVALVHTPAAVLCAPGDDRLDELAALAREDDGAVRTGLFDVEVRPWQVMFDTLDG